MAESAQMAVEAGAKWLVLDPGELSDDDVCREAADIVTLCRDGGVILTIKNNVEVARKLGLHGVYLTAGTHSAVAVREQLGPEAIIGAEIASASAAGAMASADIDYVCLTSCADTAKIISEIHACAIEIPVVAYRPGSILTPEDVSAFLEQGFNGICGGNGIFSTVADPVAEIEKIIKDE